MSIAMILGTLSNVSPIPKPIPVVILAKLLGKSSPKALLMLLAIISHLGYGGIWSAIWAAIVQKITVLKGILLGILLWFIMYIVVLPLIGWGFFGAGITPQIAIATFILHLVYGLLVGWLVDRT